MPCFMIYKELVYLPRKIDTGLSVCPSTGVWVEEGVFKDCFYLPYSLKAQSTLLIMKDSLLSAKKYQNINDTIDTKNGLLIYPNGDIVQLVITKTNDKPAKITNSSVFTAGCIKNGVFRAGGVSIPFEGVNHLMTLNNPIEDIFRYIKDSNIYEKDFFCFHIDDWPKIYEEYRIPNKQFIHHAKGLTDK